MTEVLRFRSSLENTIYLPPLGVFDLREKAITCMTHDLIIESDTTDR